MEHIKTFNQLNESSTNSIQMTFGDNNTIYNSFDAERDEEVKFLSDNDGKVGLTYTGFASEWEDYVDFETSYAYVDDGKLYVIVNGIPSHFNKQEIIAFYTDEIHRYLEDEYGEFFETEDGEPICVDVTHNGKKVLL